MVEYQGTSLVRPYVLGGRVAGAAGAPVHDPGPVPPDPHPATITIPAGRSGSVGVTRNVGYTGRTGLTVTRGQTSVTVALPAEVVDALLVVLHADTGVPYEPTDPAELAEGGGR